MMYAIQQGNSGLAMRPWTPACSLRSTYFADLDSEVVVAVLPPRILAGSVRDEERVATT